MTKREKAKLIKLTKKIEKICEKMLGSKVDVLVKVKEL